MLALPNAISASATCSVHPRKHLLGAWPRPLRDLLGARPAADLHQRLRFRLLPQIGYDARGQATGVGRGQRDARRHVPREAGEAPLHVAGGRQREVREVAAAIRQGRQLVFRPRRKGAVLFFLEGAINGKGVENHPRRRHDRPKGNDDEKLG